MEIVGFFIVCLLIFAASRSYWLEPLMVGLITYLAISSTGWHKAVVVAASIGVATLTFVVQCSSRVGYYILALLFSAFYGYVLVTLAQNTFVLFDRPWAVLTFAVTFIVSLILHWARREVLEYGTWVHLF